MLCICSNLCLQSKGSSIGWPQLQSNWRKAVALAKQDSESQEATMSARSSASSDSHFEKQVDHAMTISVLEKEIDKLQLSAQAYQREKDTLSKEVRLLCLS